MQQSEDAHRTRTVDSDMSGMHGENALSDRTRTVRKSPGWKEKVGVKASLTPNLLKAHGVELAEVFDFVTFKQQKTVDADRTRTVAEKLSEDEQAKLYQDWVNLLIEGSLTPAKRSGRAFLSARTCRGKALTLTPSEMDFVLGGWQEAAVKDGVLVLNPNHKNGTAKYMVKAAKVGAGI